MGRAVTSELALAREAGSVRKGVLLWVAGTSQLGSGGGGLVWPGRARPLGRPRLLPSGRGLHLSLPPPSPAAAAVVAAAACRSSSFDKEPPTLRFFRFLRKQWRSSHQTRNHTLWSPMRATSRRKLPASLARHHGNTTQPEDEQPYLPTKCRTGAAKARAALHDLRRTRQSQPRLPARSQTPRLSPAQVLDTPQCRPSYTENFPPRGAAINT